MPRTTIPSATIIRTGTGVAPVAEQTGDVTNQHTVGNTGRTFLLVRNSHATVAQTVTVITPGSIDGDLTIQDRVYSIPATASRYIGPYPQVDYGSSLNVDVGTIDLRLSAYNL